MMRSKPLQGVSGKTKVHLVAGARPNFMKIAPLWHAMQASWDFEPIFVHTGQHYDLSMSQAVLRDLKMPPPDYQLDIGSGSHAEQTGRAMIAYDEIVASERPDWLIVMGDVNSTLAAALVGAKRGIPTMHLEAGLRNGDLRMPEEINRRAIDAVCHLFWTPSSDATANLIHEGIAGTRITFVGNIMIDSLELHRKAIVKDSTAAMLGLGPQAYGVVTLHRAENVDDENRLKELVAAITKTAVRLPLVFPIHPRTAARLKAIGLDEQLRQSVVIIVEPMPYITFLSLVYEAAVIITDSSGLQEETSYLGIPCLTLRDSTDRPTTVWQGTNLLTTPQDLVARVGAALEARTRSVPNIPLWDGRTAERCLKDLRNRMASGRPWESVAPQPSYSDDV